MFDTVCGGFFIWGIFLMGVGIFVLWNLLRGDPFRLERAFYILHLLSFSAMTYLVGHWFFITFNIHVC